MQPRGSGFSVPGADGYFECDGGEDMACLNGVLSKTLNWDDHAVYLGHVLYCCDASATDVVNGSIRPLTNGCKFPDFSPQWSSCA